MLSSMELLIVAFLGMAKPKLGFIGLAIFLVLNHVQ